MFAHHCQPGGEVVGLQTGICGLRAVVSPFYARQLFLWGSTQSSDGVEAHDCELSPTNRLRRANVRPEHIDWKNKTLKVLGKGNREAHAPFGNLSEQCLGAWLDEYKPDSNIWGINKDGIQTMLTSLWSTKVSFHGQALPSVSSLGYARSVRL